MIPLILFNIDKQRLTDENISDSNCYCICGILPFDIEILEGNGSIFKSIISESNIRNVEAKCFKKSNTSEDLKPSNQYTIFIDGNVGDVMKLRASFDLDKNGNEYKNEYSEKIFTLEYRPENILDEITEEKYNDWLYNYDLPSYEELNNSVLLKNRADLLKRMLLDFKVIINKKGTIKSVEKFFNLIGFESSLLHIYEEYVHRYIDDKGNENFEKTISPNKLIDKKTGDYHLIYDNASNDGYDNHNLPIRKTIYENLDDFFLKLKNAIILANRYFTIQEQDISFFGLNYFSNIPMFPGITGTMCQIFDFDVHWFEKRISIDLYNYIDMFNKKEYIKNTLVTKNIAKLYKSEIKVYNDDWDNLNPDLFLIQHEFKDDEDIVDIDISKLKRMIGIVLNLDIKCENCYVEILIEEAKNPLNQIFVEKQFVEKELNIKFVNIKSADFVVTVWIWDRWNNREKWIYNYSVTIDTNLIEIEAYNSTKVYEEIHNNLNLDISSPANTNNTFSKELSYILPMDRIPEDLSQYFNDISGITSFQFVGNNKQYMLPEINPNYRLKDITDTVPLKYNDNWISVISIPYVASRRLVLYDYNTQTFRKEKFEISEIDNINLKQFKKLYVNVVDVIEESYDEKLGIINTTYKPMIFILSLENGLDFNHNTFDFRFIEDDGKPTMKEYSIYTLPKTECIIKKIPVNYDFPVKITTSTFVPDYKYYLYGESEEIKDEEEFVGSEGLIWIKSIFPRLINIKEQNESFQVKLGDVIACKCNENLLIDVNDITWTVRNSFTKKVLFSTNDFMLKYRINDQICYDIILSFFLKDKQYMIIRESMFSSFLVK